MSVPMAMLALLSKKSSHGFALKAEYDHLLGQEREVKAAQVYSTLARLERDGLCVDVGFEKGDAADRRVYAITESGVSTVNEWVHTPSLPVGRPGELFSKVVLSLTAGLDGLNVLEAHRELFLQRLRDLTASARTGDAIDRLAADYEMEHLQADLRWIDLAVQRLRSVGGSLA